MILLSEFLKNVFSLDGNPPPIWIYDGPAAITLDEHNAWVEEEGRKHFYPLRSFSGY